MPLPGDVIYSVNGTLVDGIDSLRSALDDLKTADAIALQVERLGILHYLVLETDKSAFSVGWFVLSIYSAGRDGGTSLKVTFTPRSELSCVVRTRSKSLRAQTPRVPLGKR